MLRSLGVVYWYFLELNVGRSVLMCTDLMALAAVIHHRWPCTVRGPVALEREKQNGNVKGGVDHKVDHPKMRAHYVRLTLGANIYGNKLTVN